MEKNLNNCFYHQVCYGIPIIGGTHLLFYRRDLLKRRLSSGNFQQQHHLPLRPPMTWTEFNGIARFLPENSTQILLHWPELPYRAD